MPPVAAGAVRSRSPWLLVLRWGPLVAVVIVAAVALFIGSSGSSHPTLAQQARSIEAQVRCPVCSGESVAQSPTPESLEIRQQITQELGAGMTRQQILDRLVASFGPSILEDPQTSGTNLIVWLLPVAGFLVAAAGLGLAFARWRKGSTPVGPSDQERVARELETADRPADEEARGQ
jgi:cytochrome c-type biogenesis protein CcmH